MTLNQAIRRIKTIVEAHSQVRTFGRGLLADFLTDKTTDYPAVLLQNTGGVISLGRKMCELRYRIFFTDLVHVSEDTKANETDVHSDMLSVAMDILSQISHPNYTDWILSAENNIQLFVEQDGDMYAGCYVDFTIRFMYKQNVCEVPTTKTNYQTTD
jgi:hypothetical protein